MPFQSTQIQPGFCGVRVAQFLVFCAVFYSFTHIIVYYFLLCHCIVNVRLLITPFWYLDHGICFGKKWQLGGAYLHVIIIKTKALLPQAYVAFIDIGHRAYALWLYSSQNFKFSFLCSVCL